MEEKTTAAAETAAAPESAPQQAGEMPVGAAAPQAAASPLQPGEAGDTTEAAPAEPLQPVELVFTYTKREFLRASRQYLLASKAITIKNLALVGLLLVFSLVYGAYTRFNTGSVVLLVLSLLVLGLFAVLYFAIPLRNYRAAPKYREQYHLAFSGEGIHFTTESVDSRLGWEVYAEVWENGEFFYLTTGPQAYTIVPKRVFANATQLEDFRRLVQARVGSVKNV